MSKLTQNDEMIGEKAAALDDLWSRLRLEREARGLSLADVSRHLKLAHRQIEALEQGDIAALPGPAFARGFVRNYARFLGLDPAPFLDAVESPENSANVVAAAHIYSPQLGRMPTAGGGRYSGLPAALVVLLLLIVLGLGWYFQWFEAREEKALLAAQSESSVIDVTEIRAIEPVASVVAATPAAVVMSAVSAVTVVKQSSVPGAVVSPAVAAVVKSAAVVQSSPVPSSAVSPVAAMASKPAVVPAAFSPGSVTVALPTQSAVLAKPPVVQSAVIASPPVVSGLPRLVLSFEGESWVEVRDSSGKIVFSRLNQAGSVQEVQGTPPFELVIGNATKAKLTWKGRPFDLSSSTKGDVARLTLQ